MGIFNVSKSLEKKSFYAKAAGAECPECGGDIYLEMPKEDYEGFARQLMMQKGEMIDWRMMPVNKFCHDCEYKRLKVLAELINDLDKNKELGIEKLKIGSNLNDQAKVLEGLNLLTQVFAQFMNLFEFEIELPDSDGEEEEESSIILV
jgi:hypothetical protein